MPSHILKFVRPRQVLTAAPASSGRRPKLENELLWNLALLSVAALSLAVATALLSNLFHPRFALVAILFLIGADLVILFLFGRHLIGRLVLRPMETLTRAADAIAGGALDRRAPTAETEEFTRLAERFNDMTEALLDAQSELVRAEKLAGIGRLAAGIAHEVGNPLAAIDTYLGVLDRGGADRALVESIARETRRIDRIVRELLAYARPSDDALGLVDLGAVARNAVDLLDHQGVLRGREVTVRCAPDLPSVRGRAHALEQVAVNLLLNAVDASTSGTIAVTVDAAPFEGRGGRDRVRRGDTGQPPPRKESGRRPLRPDLAVGTDGVILVVADAGPGVPPADRERIFDPFYTTKDPGRGTGLGLAIVQRTVHEAGGVVWVEDAREGGAAFKVFLPVAPPAEGK